MRTQLERIDALDGHLASYARVTPEQALAAAETADAEIAADIILSFPLKTARARAGLDRTRPKLFDFLQRIHARPAYKRALEKGGPYRYAG